MSRRIARRSRGDGPQGRRAPYDVVIVGGGPAGLSAALILGRCRRRVIVLDSGHPRNAASREMHGYLSRDGIPPRELLRLGRAEVAAYGVEIQDAEVVLARRLPPCEERPARCPVFEVATEREGTFSSRKLLLATGTRDILPGIEGIAEFYGRGVHHCPYCDAWEHRDEHLVAYGKGASAVGLALALKTWSPRVTACTDGERLGRDEEKRLEDNGISLITKRITRLEGSDGILRRIKFARGLPLECDALFFNSDQSQQSELPAMLGCPPREKGQVPTHGKQQTEVPGLYLAGDADDDVQFVIVAAAEGARAAVAINRELQDEDRGMSQSSPDAPKLRIREAGRRRAQAGRDAPRRKRPG